MKPILSLLPQEVYYRKRTRLVEFLEDSNKDNNISPTEDNKSNNTSPTEDNKSNNTSPTEDNKSNNTSHTENDKTTEDNNANVFGWLYLVYCRLRDKPHRFKFETEELFNDTAALCTMVLHDDDMPAEHYWDYYEAIRGKVGWAYQAKLTMWLAYGLLSLITPNSVKINGFLQAIDNKYNSADDLAVYREVVLDYVARAKAKGIHATPADFPLHVLSTCENTACWNSIEWRNITNDFQIEYIERLLNLWTDNNDKLFIIKRIYSAFLEEEQRRLQEEMTMNDLPF